MKEKKRTGRRGRNMSTFLVIAALVVPIYFGLSTKPPEGTSYNSHSTSVSDLRVLYDLTYLKDDVLIHDQTILDEQIRMIQAAENFIVADIFLYNDYYDTKKFDFPESTQRFTDALLAQKQKHPGLKAYLITDEINNSYRPVLNEQFRLLEDNGITVIVTDLSKVRDSNPLYAGVYRAYLKHFGTGENGWIKNPFGDNGPKVSIRNYLRMLNFKANHRKVLITEQGAMISSSNPHDGSTYHSNIAFQFSGNAVGDLLETEKTVAAFSGTEIRDVEYSSVQKTARADTAVQVLTENKIRDQILEQISSTEAGDRIDLGMFYLGHRDIIKELILAAERGVEIRVVLDPNKDAFGFEKNGIPNRQTAAELIEKSNGKIQVRWYMTHGEQYHTKVIAVSHQDTVVLIGGSANYTRRNLDNYNLETDLMVTVKNGDPIVEEFAAYFDRIWNNEEGIYTGAYSEYADDSLWKVVVYRIQEKTGLSTF